MNRRHRVGYLGPLAGGRGVDLEVSGGLDETILLGDGVTGSSGAGAVDEDSPSSGYRPRPGDGYISLNVVPSLYDSLRFLASDTSAEPKRLQSVWMQFASGWPIDFLNGMAPADATVDQECP